VKRVAVVAVVCTLSLSPAVAKPEPQLVNEELVVAELDASGLPTDATIYSRVVARDYPAGEVRDPSSTSELTYVDRRGAPETDGDAVLITVGGSGQTTVTTRAAFDKPLPVALHAQYQQGASVIAPDQVEATNGQLRIRYTVTNTTAKREVIRYRNAAGRWTVDKQPVFAPFVGTLVATIPQGLTLLEAPNAIRSTTEDGRTQLLWNLVLYPPMGNYQQDVELLVTGTPLAVPRVTMQAIPVQSKQSPTLGFSTDLLAASVEGNRELADGLGQLNQSAATLAGGAGDLSEGLRRLGTGTDTLARQVNAILVPGSRQLAQGALDIAQAQRQAARGASRLADAQQQAADGARSAYDGAKSLEEGATALSDGLLSLYDGLQELLKPGALPAARDSADQLSQAVLRVRQLIGTRSDPDIGFPPTQGSTLIQAVRAAQKAAGVSAAGSQRVQENLQEIAASLGSLSQQLVQTSTNAGAAAAKTAQVYQQACVVAPVLDAATCATLQEATSDANAARQSAGDIAWDVGKQSGKVTEQAIASAAITASLAGLAGVFGYLDAALSGISGALVSGTTATPGIYEGMQALRDGLTATINGLVKLSNGAAQSTGGAQLLADGTGDLSTGLDDLADGAQKLAEGSDELAAGSQQLAQGTEQLAQGSAAQADGTEQVGGALVDVNSGVNSAAGGASELARGAGQLQSRGTQRVLNQVVKASNDPAFAKAYLKATEARAADALPYGAPDGASGRVAYLYTMAGTRTDNRTSTWAGWALAALLLAAAAAVAWRRLHPVEAPVTAAEEPVEEQTELEPVADDPAPEEPDVETVSADNDWLFRPQDEQPPN
jgi:putative membrane protein